MRPVGESALRYLANHPPKKVKKLRHPSLGSTTIPKPPIRGEGQLRRGISREAVQNLEQELAAEKHRADAAEVDHWRRSAQLRRERESKRLFPRSLEGGTFFTPHLHSKRGLALKDNSGVEREWCVVLPNLNVVRTPYNPVRVRSRKPVTDTKYRLIVSRLEADGWRFIGTNNDIYIFERQFNGRVDGQQWARSAAATLTGAVACLLGLIYTGEWLFFKKHKGPGPANSEPAAPIP